MSRRRAYLAARQCIWEPLCKCMDEALKSLNTVPGAGTLSALVL